jgi:hypothetical protein
MSKERSRGLEENPAIEKLGQFLSDVSCLWSQKIDGTWESLQQLDDGVCAFDNTAMGAVIFE